MLNSCCCCIDLRTGGIVLGLLSVLGGLGSIGAIIQTGYWTSYVNVIWCAIGICVLFGIFKNKPKLLLSFVIFTPIHLVSLFITIAISNNLIAYVVFAIICAILIYSALCIYSLFKSMQDGGHSLNI